MAAAETESAAARPGSATCGESGQEQCDKDGGTAAVAQASKAVGVEDKGSAILNFHKKPYWAARVCQIGERFEG